MDNSQCFVCADDCNKSNSNLVNTQSKKYKSQYTALIGNLLQSEYELRVCDFDRVCERCVLLLERFDELQQETKTVKSVLARQIALRYGIETDQELLYLDKSKIFSPIRNSNKFNCKHCPAFVSDNVDLINYHVLYHQYQIEEQKKIQPVFTKLPESTVITKKPSAITTVARELIKKELEAPKLKVTKSSATMKKVEVIHQPIEQIQSFNATVQDCEEDTLDSLIDMNLLDDQLYDSNLRDHNCMFKECDEKFIYASNYVRHLKIKHKLSLNHIFAALRTNLKRPAQVTKLMCPYCFTKTINSNALEEHVKTHEDTSAQSNLFINRLNTFVTGIMKEARCEVCDSDIPDVTSVKCNHFVAKNGLARKIDCKDCDAYFYSDKLYNNHLAVMHCQCFFCGMKSEDKSILKDHINSHLVHTEYPCSFCNEIYQTKSNQRNHIRQKHSSNCCQHCGEWYFNTTDLEHHVRHAHADKRFKEKPTVCDTCGGSFKHKALFETHALIDHIPPKKCYKCSKCPNTFEFRYLLMDHFATIHNRTIVDNEVNFYKCCFCQQSFSSQNRKNFLQHLQKHQNSQSYCYDCNINFDTRNMFDDHREKSHQDFSRCVDKKPLINDTNMLKLPPQGAVETAYEQLKSFKKEKKQNVAVSLSNQTHQVVHEELAQEMSQIEQDEQQLQPQQQQIIVQSEDGSLLNMNNLILTENGELIIQNFDGLLPNGVQEGEEGTQIQISNLEQFLLEQGLSANTEISYIQGEDGNLVALQNDDGTLTHTTQESLLQTYKEIFEPEDIPNELIGESEVATQQHDQNNILMNGDYIIQADIQQPQIQVDNNQAVNAANQSTLDELGDILLEVAAAAEKEKKPKSGDSSLRETLWGKKRVADPPKDVAIKRRNGKQSTPIITEVQKPAQNFSQAYELFVKGFDATKKKTTNFE